MTKLPNVAATLFNGASKTIPPVRYQLSECERLGRQGQYAEYYEHQISNIRTYFRIKGFETADAVLDVLLQLKADDYNWRKDGYTPQVGHELDLVLSRISAIENGQIDVAAAEAKYGSIEGLLISTLVHDLGEDCGLMPNDFMSLVYHGLTEKLGHRGISDHHRILVGMGTQSMERLTHDRHYRRDDFIEKFSDEFRYLYKKTLEVPHPEPSAAVPLAPDVQDFLSEKMFEALPQETTGEFQAFVMISPKGRPRITVTRYGKQVAWGADWNAYSQGFMAHPYDAATKFADSANGMTSRLSIESFTADGANRYLRKRAQLFDHNKAAQRAIIAYPEFAKDFRSVGSMMGMSYVMGRMLLNHDPMMNDNGESGFSARSLAEGPDGLIHMDLKRFPEFAFDSYALVPGLSHPIGRFMQQYRDVASFYEGHRWHDDVAFLYEQTRGIMIRDCHDPAQRNGLNIQKLIDTPETYNPLPRFCENLPYGYDQPSTAPS